MLMEKTEMGETTLDDYGEENADSYKMAEDEMDLYDDDVNYA